MVLRIPPTNLHSEKGSEVDLGGRKGKVRCRWEEGLYH